MIRVNGVSLDYPEMGWVLRPGSVPYSAYEADLAKISLPGRDGNVPSPSAIRAPLWPLTVNTTPDGWEPLLALFRSSTLLLTRDDRPGLEIIARFATSNIEKVYPGNKFVEVTFILELTGAYWRSQAVSTFSTVGGRVVCWPIGGDHGGLSAPVQDAVIRAKAPASPIQVTDSSGAWLTLPAASGGQWVRFEADSGRAYRTTTDTWVGGTDISGQVDFGGPRGVFEITPTIVAGPDDRAGILTVTGGGVEVRGRSAHAI